jgi:hypothetical protein
VATAPTHEGFGEPSHLDKRVNYEGKPPRHGDTAWVIHLIESDRGLRLAKVLWAAGLTALTVVDVSYAAPQVHEIVNVALHREYSLGIIFIFSQGRKNLYHV